MVLEMIKVSAYIRSVYADTRRMAFLQKLTQHYGVPMAFMDDAVQDIIISTWLRCPEGRGWYMQARWGAMAAGRRYGDHAHTVNLDDIITVLKHDSWELVEKILDFKAAVAKLSPVMLRAVEAAAISEQGARHVHKPKRMTGSQRIAASRARVILRREMS